MSSRRTIKGRTLRHVIVVSVLLLFLAGVGMVVFQISHGIAAVAVVKQNVSSSRAESIASYSEPASSSPGVSVSSSPVSSDAASSAVSKPPASSVPVASHPYNPTSTSSTPSVPTWDPSTYQSLYPNLYAPKTETITPVSGKVVYLTFDDGTSNLTMPLLDILDRYKIKATFFLVGKTDKPDLDAMKAIVDRGHAIGVHSYTHRMKDIYASPTAFLNDFSKMHDLILKTTGVDTKIYRYAGGSVNGYNKNTAKAIITEMDRRGYTYFDWNVDSGDAESGSTAASIYHNVISEVHAHSQSVILCHNTAVKVNTLHQIPKIIETLQKEGYRFDVLSPSVDSKLYNFRKPK